MGLAVLTGTPPGNRPRSKDEGLRFFLLLHPPLQKGNRHHAYRVSRGKDRRLNLQFVAAAPLRHETGNLGGVFAPAVPLLVVLSD